MILAAYVFGFQRPDGRWGVVNDDKGRLIATQLGAVADTFAKSLKVRGVPSVMPVEQTPIQIADLILSGGIKPDDVPEHFFLIESESLDAEDAAVWAADLADLVPLTTALSPTREQARA